MVFFVNLTRFVENAREFYGNITVLQMAVAIKCPDIYSPESRPVGETCKFSR